jgi:hypothetical protein
VRLALVSGRPRISAPGTRWRTASARCVTGTRGPNPDPVWRSLGATAQHCCLPRRPRAPTVVRQTREQTRAFHGGDVQSTRAGLVASSIRVTSRERRS